MTEYILTLVRDPIFWVLAALPLFGLINLVASLYLRKSRRRLIEVINSMTSDARITKADKAFLRAEIGTSGGRHLLFAAPFAPAAILAAVVLGFVEGWQARNKSRRLFDLQTQIDRLQRESDTLTINAVKATEGHDPSAGVFWDDPRRREVQELSHVIETWSNPLATLWILFWLAMSAPLLVVGYLASGSIRPFVVNLWEPIRDPILSGIFRQMAR